MVALAMNPFPNRVQHHAFDSSYTTLLLSPSLNPNQCDQTLELKIAIFHQSCPKGAKAVFYSEWVVFKMAQKVAQIWVNFVTEYVSKTFQN